jgi:hypothetical protein
MANEKNLHQRTVDLLHDVDLRLKKNPNEPHLKLRREEIKNVLSFVDEPDDLSRRSAWRRIREMEKDPMSAGNHNQYLNTKKPNT